MGELACSNCGGTMNGHHCPDCQATLGMIRRAREDPTGQSARLLELLRSDMDRNVH